MRKYNSEKEFHNELVLILEMIKKRFYQVYFRRYLKDGIFEFVVYDGDAENYTSYYIAAKLNKEELVFIKNKWRSGHHTENWGNEPIYIPTEEELMKDYVKVWIDNSNRYWRMYSKNKEYGIKLSDI